MWKKLTSVFMSVVLVAGLCPGLAFAEGGLRPASAKMTEQGEVSGVSEIAYDGDAVKFVKSDLTSEFGMMSNPSGDMRVSRSGGKVHVVFTPKNQTVYAGFYLGADVKDNTTWAEGSFVAAEDDLSYDFSVDESYCGSAWPVAFVKVSDKAATTKDQYYLAIPSKDKIAEEGAASVDYLVDVEAVKGVDASAASYSMFVPTVDGVEKKARVTVAGDKATVSFYVPRNTYNAIYLGALEATELGQLPTDARKASDEFKAGEAVTVNGTACFAWTFDFAKAWLGTVVPFVTVSKKDGKFNKTQLGFKFGSALTPLDVFDVESKIAALPAAPDVTVRDGDAIKAARAAYDALPEDNRALVSNYAKLQEAEAAFAGLAEMSDEAKAVVSSIDALLTSYLDVTEATASAVAAARVAFDALDEQQRAYVDDAARAKLARAEACVQVAKGGDVVEGWLVDAGVDANQGPVVAISISPRSGAAYVYLYLAAGVCADTKLKSGTATKSTKTTAGDGKVLKCLYQLKTDGGQGREFSVVPVSGANEGDPVVVKVPEMYGVMPVGEYAAAATQAPESKMRKFEGVRVTSDGAAMTATFTMPNTSYDKIYLGTAEQAAADEEHAVAPAGTAATSGTTGEGNVYSIPLESMSQPVVISYHAAKSGKWTQETVKFTVDDQTKACIGKIAELSLDAYFNVTAEQRSIVDEAAALYDALDDGQKALMDCANAGVLKRVRAMFAAADESAKQIAALPAADEMTQSDVSAVRAAKTAFDSMGQSEAVLAVIPNGLANKQIEKLVSEDLRNKLDACVAKADKLNVPEVVDLTITNNTGMFKAVSASVEIAPTGEKTIVMALSSTGYHELFKGTYEQAVANGANTDNWIHGSVNDDGKWEFRIPLAEDESYVPCVAISDSYYTKYLNGQNSVERAFYPRQLTIDLNAKTLVTDDFAFSQGIAVTNNVKMFKVSSAKLDTVGGPNSNGYASTLALTMGSESFDKAFVGSAADASATAKTIDIAEGGVFAIPVKWVAQFGKPETLVSLANGEAFTVSFHSVNKNEWYERVFKLDEAAGTLVIDEPAKEEPAKVDLSSAAVALAWTSKAFNGQVQKPAVVTVAGKALKLGQDYTVAYSNPNSKDAGAYTLTVTGRGDYVGATKPVAYEIAKAPNPMKVTAKAKSKKKAAKAKAGKSVAVLTVAQAQGKVSVVNKTKKGAAKKFKVVFKGGKVKVVVPKKAKKGIYKVMLSVAAAGDGNYAASGAQTVTCWVKVK